MFKKLFLRFFKEPIATVLNKKACINKRYKFRRYMRKTFKNGGSTSIALTKNNITFLSRKMFNNFCFYFVDQIMVKYPTTLLCFL